MLPGDTQLPQVCHKGMCLLNDVSQDKAKIHVFLIGNHLKFKINKRVVSFAFFLNLTTDIKIMVELLETSLLCILNFDKF